MIRHGQTRRSRRVLACCTAALLTVLPVLSLFGAGPSEYTLKAAFLYKFLLFTDFTYVDSHTSPERLSICIWGKDPFGEAFAPITGLKINNRPLAVRRLGATSDSAQLESCQVLFISGDNQADQVLTVLQMTRLLPVLTVGEHPNFLRWGGIIRIYEKQARVVFAVNADAGRQVGIGFRSQMLRVAIQVIDEGTDR